MRDAKDLNMLIKQSAMAAVNSAKLTKLVFGTVTNDTPLAIMIEQKMTLGPAQLILTRNVTDYEMTVTIDHETEGHEHTHTIRDTFTSSGSCSAETHSHSCVGRKTVVIHNALSTGERVVMARQEGGQQFLVIDRVVVA